MTLRKHPEVWLDDSERRPFWLKYALAVITPLLALPLRFMFDPWLGDRQPFVFFYAAVAVTGAFGGWRPAVLAMMITVVLGDYFFIPPRGALALFSSPDAALNAGAYAVVSSVMILVTDRLHRARQRARQVAHAHERLATMVENSAEAIIGKDLNGIIFEWNPGAEALFGYAAEEAVGKSIKIIIPSEREAEEAGFMQKLRAGEVIRNVETVRWNKQRELLEVSVTLSPIRNSRGEVVGGVNVAHDIRRLKQAERELRKRKAQLEVAKTELEQKVVERTQQLEQTVEELRSANRLKSEFLATMSHELRTPLNSIIGFTEIVKEGMAGPVNETQKTQLGMAHGSAKHLLNLINDLLDLSRIEAGRSEIYPEWFDPAALMNEAVKTLEPTAARKQLAILTEFKLPRKIFTDRKKVFQVVLNLLSNAVKFTSEGEVRVRANVDHGQLRVSVRDTGIGIKPENMDLLFNAFQQMETGSLKRFEGTGLGLYLSRKLVRMLGGDLEAESELGKGSEFRFWIPIHSQK